MHFAGAAIVALIASLLWSSRTQAELASIPGLWPTGVSNASAMLSGGSADPHYNLISSPDGNQATVMSSQPGVWQTNGPISQWISSRQNGLEVHPAGTYTYRATFDLANFDPATASLSGSWASDNDGTIQLNGVTKATGPDGIFTLTAFAINSGFVPGINTLDFVVLNTGSGLPPNPSGLRVELSGTAQTVPEPAGCAMMLGAILMAAPFSRRKGSQRQGGSSHGFAQERR